MAAMFFSLHSFIYILTITILLSASCCLTEGGFYKPMKQKISHLRMYWHEIRSGSAPTAVPVLNSTTNATFLFGMIIMTDDPLTMGPKMSSQEVGRAQGLYAWVSQETYSASMTMNFVFTYGKYNGSTITIVGNNPTLLPVREVPVIGGTGLFRFARGYARIRNIMFNQTTNDVLTEYKITVMHY